VALYHHHFCLLPTDANLNPTLCGNLQRRSYYLFMSLLVVPRLAMVILSIALFGTNVELSVDAQDAPAANGTYRWETLGNNGLDLVVENALDYRWTPYFNEYTAVWDTGEPDALTITARRITTDSLRVPSFGRRKVCNGNYGATDWKGENINLVRNGFIVFGICRMNDYFLDEASSDVDKKCTMLAEYQTSECANLSLFSNRLTSCSTHEPPDATSLATDLGSSIQMSTFTLYFVSVSRCSLF
jgi:hypothetical protein